MKQIKALFLDRDGVINEDFGYVYKISDFKFRDGIFTALREFSELNYTIIIVTNQSGIGRGYYTLEQFLELNEFMLNEFSKNGVNIAKVYFCPHAPEENCECRKPRAGMILNAQKELNVDLKSSIMIGDKQSDIDAANTAKIGLSFLLDGENFKNVIDVLDWLKRGKIL
ncbi:D-glycero-beta-D-manno-heptose 1,7-bisphosphate 7-phosphatase [Campylobacter mucosalis]|uniref:D,D-heptose 1,7-bisphosphate phosphatase n=1 Tax=Campylobacter mucosalis CCUG 21559 TaxID=1032067 RepID=A0A6G5QGT6_9BACT|nr:D-glycero-beta-D-manno-heptose 1,7-bisphosphate 7-phosphatase [Campylobacter mucosalis]QCD44880.1 D,D-heptose 1,7-bisphosphate phosphatase [Campylobacter mucosalis CCUG 21559]